MLSGDPCAQNASLLPLNLGYLISPHPPVVDFDDDGSVEMDDLLAMIGSWGTDERLCDIGPMPWGDGVVDEVDLETLMGYWGKDVTVGKPDLVAHWAFSAEEIAALAQ